MDTILANGKPSSCILVNGGWEPSLCVYAHKRGRMKLIMAHLVCDCALITTYLDPQDDGRGHSDSILVFDHAPYSAVNNSIVLFMLQHKTKL